MQSKVDLTASDGKNDLPASKENLSESAEAPCIDIALHLVKQLDQSPTICGVTSLENFICILSRHSVKVYEDQNPFELLKTINIPINCEPWDIASCEQEKCLYMTDVGSQSIWKINPLDSHMKVWLTKLENLSTVHVSSNGCVLLVKDMKVSTQLLLYASDAKLLRVLSLQDEIKCPTHAIQKPSGEFIVAHRWGDLSGPWVISQLNQEGKIINQFKPANNRTVLNFPWHLSLDSNSFKLFVADVENDRVILFDSVSLVCCKILLTEAKDEIYHPWRIWFNDKRRQLIVGQLNGFVDVYDIN